MATSGLHITEINDIASIQFSWRRTSYSVVDNTSTVTWELNYVAKDNKLTNYTQSGPVYVVFIGNDEFEGEIDSIVEYKVGTQFIASGTTVIPHNADGTRRFTFTYSFGYRSMGTKSGSGYETLDSLPRPATITDAPNFNDDMSPLITYTVPNVDSITKLEACVSFTGTKDDVPYREIDKTQTTYRFNFTSEERTILRKGVTSGRQIEVRFYLRSTINGVTYHSYITKTLVLVSYTPTLSPVIKDVNSRTIALTGDSNKLIKYYSNAQVTFGAAARKEATIVDRRVICGNQTIEIEDSAQDTVIVNGVESNTFYLRARDNRGNSEEDALTKTLIPYIKLTNSLKTNALDSTGKVTFTISGKYFNGSFGAKNNSMEVEYTLIDEEGNPAFNADGSGWVILGTVSPTVTDGTYKFSHTVTGLDYRKIYTLTVNVIDELTPVQTSSRVIAAVPVFDWSKSDFAHHTNVYFDNQKRIYGKTVPTDLDEGTLLQVIDPCNQNNNLVIGYGNYNEELLAPDGTTPAGSHIYGNAVRIYNKNGLYINGRKYGENKILWSGAYYMMASHTVKLNEAISAQPNGIVLVFSLYRNGAAEDVSINSFFVSKKEVELLPGAPHTFLMGINAGFSNIGAKYLYIDDTQIVGHEGNTLTGANSGITFSNNSYVLRYVIGV